MADKYLVDLTEEEQGYLLDVIHKGKTAARRVARAHVLLRAAEGTTDEDIAKTLHLGIASVHRIRQRFVDEGLTAALSERLRSGSPPALTGDRRIPNIETLQEEIAAWQSQRNQRLAKIHWQFDTDVARVKLKRLYPSLEPAQSSVGPKEVSKPIKTSAAAH